MAMQRLYQIMVRLILTTPKRLDGNRTKRDKKAEAKLIKAREKTSGEIQREIADLAGRRDVMLKNAPKHVFFARLIVPLILVSTLLGLMKRLSSGRLSIGGALMLLLICAIVGRAFHKLWRPGYSPGDLWGASDRVGYDGESPRDLQRRIEALEALLRERDRES